MLPLAHRRGRRWLLREAASHLPLVRNTFPSNDFAFYGAPSGDGQSLVGWLVVILGWCGVGASLARLGFSAVSFCFHFNFHTNTSSKKEILFVRDELAAINPADERAPLEAFAGGAFISRLIDLMGPAAKQRDGHVVGPLGNNSHWLEHAEGNQLSRWAITQSSWP